MGVNNGVKRLDMVRITVGRQRARKLISGDKWGSVNYKMLNACLTFIRNLEDLFVEVVRNY